jgi:uncharacterized protein involved in exopolysaccharide biosynthesis/protein involved in polysaccharide export with SLBB domain
MENSTNRTSDGSIDTGTVLSGNSQTHADASIKEDSKQKDDEISLIDLLAVLLKYKKMIIGITVAAALFIVCYSIVSIKMKPEKSPLPNEYTPKALMLINNSSSSSGGLSSMLSSSGLGSLASLAGVSASGTSYSSLAVYLSTTDSFLDTVVDKFDLIKKYKIQKSVRAESRKALKKHLKTEYDEESGVLSISFKDTDPQFACEVVNFCVDYMEKRFNELGVDKNKIEKENLEKNISASYDEFQRLQKKSQNVESEAFGGSSSNIPSIVMETNRIQLELKAQEQVYTQLKTQYELLKVKMQSETPVFQVLEKATVPDQKSGPSRGKLCIIVTFAAFFISIFLAFLLNAIENVRHDPEAMRKLSSQKKRKFAAVSMIFVLCTSFATAESTNEKSSTSIQISDSAQVAMSIPDYLVTSGDIYSLNYAIGSTAVSYSILVDSSYKIPVSNLAILNCAGMTFIELKNQVESIVRKNYPMSGVQFMLVTPSHYQIKITGEVVTATEKTAWPLSRLSDLLTDVMTDYSSTRNITIISSTGKKTICDLFKAKRDGDFSNNPYLRPGDSIFINRVLRKVTITGQVERPGTYELLDGEDLKTLVELYGNSLTQYADTTRMELIRTASDSNKQDSTKVNTIRKIYLPQDAITTNYKLVNLDSINIPSLLDIQPVLFFEGAVNSNNVASPEVSVKVAVTFKPGDNLATIVRQNHALFSSVSDTSNAYIIREDQTIKVNLDRLLYDNSYYSDIVLQNSDILMIPFRQYFITVSGAVSAPGRYPYIPGRNWQYYIGLAGGIIPEKNSNDTLIIKDINGNKRSKDDPITPETNIYAPSNSLMYIINTYSTPFATIISLVYSSILVAYYLKTTQW